MAIVITVAVGQVSAYIIGCWFLMAPTLVSPLCVHVNLLPHFPEIPSASGRVGPVGALPGTTAMQGIILGVRVNMTISAVEHCQVEHVARNWAALFIYYHMRVISK